MLTTNLSLKFDGPHDAIVQTLQGVAELMQNQVDTRTERRRDTVPSRLFETTAYLDAAAQQFRRMAAAFASAEKAFAAAGSHGSPQALAEAYRQHLDAVLSVRETMLAIQAPAKFAGIGTSYAEFTQSYYDRCASWPAQIRDATTSVCGNSVAIELVANYDMSTIERALTMPP